MDAKTIIDQFWSPFHRRITESPETIRLSDTVKADYRHPSARAFAIIGSTVANTPRTHPFIFNALKAVQGKDAGNMYAYTLRNSGPEGVYEEFRVEFAPHLPTAEDLAWFNANTLGEMGAQREVTRSGRIWRGVQVDDSKISAMSFWVEKSKVSDADLKLVVEALKLEAPIYVEFMDSTRPELYGQGPSTQELRSKIRPELTSRQIIDILVKAHTDPSSLSGWEKAVVAEYRGSQSAPAKPDTTGFSSAAERRFRSTIGDSVGS